MSRSPNSAARTSPANAQAVEARARKLERAGDAAGAVAAFEAALAAAPHDADLLAGLARLAERIQSPELALGCWTLVRTVAPASLEAVEGAARGLGHLGRTDEAMDLLRAALRERPDAAGLWTTLGRLANEQDDTEGALLCFGEAARLDPRSAAARYNRGGVHMEQGDLAAAADDFRAALKLASSPSQRAAAQLADGFVKLCEGRLQDGWRGYEARLSPHRPDAPIFEAPGRRWTPEARLDGAHLLVVGEQGVGDQIMFANLLADARAAVGPQGRLSVALDPRLAGLVGRSLPGVEVLPLITELAGGRAQHRVLAPAEPAPRFWAPLASLAQRFRGRLEDFPQTPAFLAADPAAVAQWRAWLGEGPPVVGLTWRSRAKATERRRAGAGLAAWRPILQTPGLRFVNLQYGVSEGELAEARGLAAGEVLEPPGLDLFNDLDGLAALLVALDLVVATPNATGLLAAACGAPTRLLDAPLSWRRLGTAGYPWHPAARCFPAAAGGDWDAAIAAIADELARL